MAYRLFAGMSTRKGVGVLLLAGVIAVTSLCGGPAEAAGAGRYQVVNGGENGYLVDTETGAVWVLTHRTLPTGREPVAIPYKFLKISPKDAGRFLIESEDVPAGSPKMK